MTTRTKNGKGVLVCFLFFGIEELIVSAENVSGTRRDTFLHCNTEPICLNLALVKTTSVILIW
jgi:hypothetical protein